MISLVTQLPTGLVESASASAYAFINHQAGCALLVPSQYQVRIRGIVCRELHGFLTNIILKQLVFVRVIAA